MRSKTSWRIRLATLGFLGLACFHFLIDLRLDKPSHLMMSVLVWLATGVLCQDRQDKLLAQSPTVLGRLAGIGLLTALILMGLYRPSDVLTGFFPLVAVLGWGLTCFSAAQLLQMRRVWIVLVAFGMPKLLPERLNILHLITAAAATFALWAVGVPVALNGDVIYVTQGSVQVVPSCSGLALMTHLFSIAITFLALFPVRRWDWVRLPSLAILIGFVVNAGRVALLAVLSPTPTQGLFAYWHSANGASWFVLLALAIFGGLAWVWLQLEQRAEHMRSPHP